MQQQESISLQVKTTDAAIVQYLLELMWYHNGSVVVPDERTTLSNKNKTLSITNFTSFDAGIYKVEFNKLFVYPYDDNCNKEVVSHLRNSPLMKSVVFCINMGKDCPEDAEQQSITLQSRDSNLLETLSSISLEAIAMVHDNFELEHSSIQWYRNGIKIWSPTHLQMNHPRLSLAQDFQKLNASYEHSGRYEVRLSIDLLSADIEDSICEPHYNDTENPYLDIDMYSLVYASAVIDIDFYRGNHKVYYSQS